MSAILASQATAPPPKSDPFRLGWRTVVRHLDDGTDTEERIPLTEWDLLHPQEDDFIVQNQAHVRDCIYLKQAIEKVTADRADIVVFYDQRIDWQEPGVLPHGPDITVLAEVTRPWDPQIGTFPVRDMNAKVLLVVEVVSPSCWKNDVVKKLREYHQAKIPYYVIVDTRENKDDGQIETGVIGFRTTPEAYVPLADDPKRGIWIPTVGIGFKGEFDRLRCVDREGQAIPERAELEDQMQESLERERLARAAEAAAQSFALQEKLRADAAEDRIRELEDQLKNRQS